MKIPIGPSIAGNMMRHDEEKKMNNVLTSAGITSTDINSILVAAGIALALVGGLVIVQKSWRAFLRWKAEQYHLQSHHGDDICREKDGIMP